MTIQTVKVGDIAEQVRGVTYSKSDASGAESEGTVAILRANNITDQGLQFSNLVWVPKSCVSSKQMLRKGDIVVATSSGSLVVVGKAAPVENDVEASFGAFCKVVRPGKTADSHYLANYFKTAKYRSIISSLAAGANINNLRNEHINSLEIPLPPLAEQKRIAAILDKADAIRRKLQQSLRLSDDFLRSVFLDMFGDPVTNPKGIPKTALGDIIKLKSGNSLVAKDMAEGGLYPVYGGNGINGYHDSFMFEKRMIVLGRVGAYCGAVHHTLPQSWITDNALYVESMKKKMDPIYLVDALRFANLNQYAGQAGQPLISGGRVYPVEILDPSPVQETAYAAIVTKTQTKINKSKSLLQEAEVLFSSLQQRAFRGEL